MNVIVGVWSVPINASCPCMPSLLFSADKRKTECKVFGCACDCNVTMLCHVTAAGATPPSGATPPTTAQPTPTSTASKRNKFVTYKSMSLDIENGYDARKMDAKKNEAENAVSVHNTCNICIGGFDTV